MILQCDQCNTKFRLDDAKLKPGGVKVRCSKCRHVFLAGADIKHEESEFDAILSGLGAPQAEKPTEAPAPDTGIAADFGFDAEPAAPVERSAFEVPSPASAGDEAAPTAEAKTGMPEPDDFSAFDFPTEPFETPTPPASNPEPDYSAFDFAPPQAPSQEPAAAAATPGLEYGEFAFDEEPAPLREDQATAAGEPLDFGEFSFAGEGEPSQQKETPVGLDFGEFDFVADSAAKAPQEPAAPDGLDYGDFSFADEAAPAVTAPVAAAKNGTDAPAAADSFDFGAFSFSEEPAALQEEPEPAKKELDFGEFSFDEVEPPKPAAAAPAPVTPEAAGTFSFSEPVQDNKAQDAPAVDDGFNFDEFSFAPDSSSKTAAATPVEHPQEAAAPAVAAAPAAEPAATPGFTAGTPIPPPRAEDPFDFDLGNAAVPNPEPEPFGSDDELLPPLSIASRRKGRSILTVSVVTISVLVIVALSGAGLYLLQSGPAAFDKLGLGFVAKWFGMESVEEGRITVRNQLAAFHQNKEAGELFVVTGEALNSFRKARASIHVKVSLYDKKGAVLLQKTAYCGNRLSNEQLQTLPMAKIESIMNNQFGDSLSNLGVPPGGAIGFVVAIPNVPKEAADFGVEVVGSTVAGK
jgi:predicted Zn finger-like uncharacterized protein